MGASAAAQVTEITIITATVRITNPTPNVECSLMDGQLTWAKWHPGALGACTPLFPRFSVPLRYHRRSANQCCVSDGLPSVMDAKSMTHSSTVLLMSL